MASRMAPGTSSGRSSCRLFVRFSGRPSRKRRDMVHGHAFFRAGTAGFCSMCPAVFDVRHCRAPDARQLSPQKCIAERSV